MNSTTQYILDLDPITTPSIFYSQKLGRVGRIHHLLKDETEHTADSRAEVILSKRRKEHIYKLENGNKIIVTKHKTHPEYNEVDGILSVAFDKPKWLYNKKYDSFEAYLKRGADSTYRNSVSQSWKNKFYYSEEFRSNNGEVIQKGLRKPQLGALHAIKSYWTLKSDAATIVMPTGTGKTETMLSTIIAEGCECVLVVVPSISLREQSVRKFKTLGILKEIGAVDQRAEYPVVGELEKRPKLPEDLKIFDKCNVVVSTINSVAQGTAENFLDDIKAKCSHLIIDEAHHVPASSWSRLKEVFSGKPILQFTATPYREDKSPIKGEVIYNYPLIKAQEDGIFREINFQGVFETDPERSDGLIAEKAIKQLREDIVNGYEHILMARCKSIKRAKDVFEIYKEKAFDLNPTLIHSTVNNADAKIQALIKGDHKIVVTVNMLSEGFDLPRLKLAAMHDKFKSLAITLQFAGRFTRESSESIGVATIIANTGLEDVYSSLQSLYDEDSDWNKIIADLSFDKIEEEQALLQFLKEAQRIDSPDEEDLISITPQSLQPKFSTLIYRASSFNPFSFYNVAPTGQKVVGAWNNTDPQILFFITKSSENLIWCKNKGISETKWDIYVLYFSQSQNLLFIHSTSDSNNQHKDLAKAVTNDSAQPIFGENIFRVFDGIKRLMLNQVGLLHVGPRNMRYSMFTGKDIKSALNEVIKSNSKKSNLFGYGFEDGEPSSVGCSQKGKIWTRGLGPILQWSEWCDKIGEKVTDSSINVDSIIENVLKPEEVNAFPELDIFYIDWPDRLYKGVENKISFLTESTEYHFSELELRLGEKLNDKQLNFYVSGSEIDVSYLLNLGNEFDYGYKIERINGPELFIKVWANSKPLHEYLNDSPPVIFFIDQSEMEGNILTKSRELNNEFPIDQLQVIDWKGVDITVESMYGANGEYRENSIQEWVMNRCIDEEFAIIFNDDGANEIADVVAIKEVDSGIVLRMMHCKFSSVDTPGARVLDVAEVASQATKNVRWFWSFDKLLNRLSVRENKRTGNKPSRFFNGTLKDLKYFKRLQSIKGKIRREIIIVQPGISKDGISNQMISILGSADAFHKTTLETPLQVWCSV
ncbi:MAG: DEAD/DEAH box helicase family protein [Balneolaceae bacterium]|nr:DEAD/DEAH box helicase family protein [Balneolaceae bacterium]